MSRSKTLTDAENFVRRKDLTLISYSGSFWKMNTVMCEMGHVWETKFTHFKRCQSCHRPDEELAKFFVEMKGFKLKKYAGNVSSPDSVFECEQGHTWKTSYSSVVNKGTKCKECADVDRSLSEKDINQKLSENHIVLVSHTGRINGHSTFKCLVCKNTWSTQAGKVLYKKTGCPLCAKSGYKANKTGYVYVLVSDDKQAMKIGISNVPRKRLLRLRKSTPFGFRVSKIYRGPGDVVQSVEKEIHQMFDSANFTGFDGCTEWCKYNENVLVYCNQRLGYAIVDKTITDGV